MKKKPLFDSIWKKYHQEKTPEKIVENK
jgi:hypothetical protein